MHCFSEMKDELRKSLSVQWEMEQERVEMIESLAHDLKSPLSIIMGYTDSLIDSNRNDNGKLYRYLSVIKKMQRRVRHLFSKCNIQRI